MIFIIFDAQKITFLVRVSLLSARPSSTKLIIPRDKTIPTLPPLLLQSAFILCYVVLYMSSGANFQD
jgi:hypothetical protein